SESKPSRPTTRRRASSEPASRRPADEDQSFGAGILEETATPLAVQAPPPNLEVVEPARPPPPRIDPNEHGFDAETNSRYEEIKRGSTYITQLQQMTLAQLQKAAREDNIPREEWSGLKKQDLIFRI